jgi:hypothetical protein
MKCLAVLGRTDGFKGTEIQKLVHTNVIATKTDAEKMFYPLQKQF